jgi:hypothetical protein
MQCPGAQGVHSRAAAAAAAAAGFRYDLDHRSLGFNKVKELVK